MKKITISEKNLIDLIESEIAIVNKGDLKGDWDSERIVNSIKRNKNMYVKTKNGLLKQVDRKPGQTKVYFLKTKEANEANDLIKQINLLKSKLDDILN